LTPNIEYVYLNVVVSYSVLGRQSFFSSFARTTAVSSASRRTLYGKTLRIIKVAETQWELEQFKVRLVNC